MHGEWHLTFKYFTDPADVFLILFNCFTFLALRLGLVQMAVGINKMDNINRACKLIRDAAKKGAKLVALPVSAAFVGQIGCLPLNKTNVEARVDHMQYVRSNGCF